MTKNEQINEWTIAGSDINKLFLNYENDVDRADRSCGKLYGGFKAFKKENKEKYRTCRKAGHIQAIKAYTQALQSFNCRNYPRPESCVERINKDFNHVKVKLIPKIKAMKESYTLNNIYEEVDVMLDNLNE